MFARGPHAQLVSARGAQAPPPSDSSARYTRLTSRLPALRSFRSAQPLIFSIDHAPLQRHYLAFRRLLFCPSNTTLSRVFLSLTDDLVKDTKDLTNKYFKAFNYSASACTAFGGDFPSKHLFKMIPSL
ncbi:hypothetical protein I3843_11G095600 [Carya illinoinensis]|nr:hypothetical protein I3843_11G095600 [Carya illinoinensis]